MVMAWKSEKIVFKHLYSKLDLIFFISIRASVTSSNISISSGKFD